MTVADLLLRLRDAKPDTLVRVSINGGPHLPASDAFHACYWVGNPPVAFVIEVKQEPAK